MFSKNDLAEVLQIALKNGGDFADIFIERKQSNFVACEQDRIERIDTGTETGAGIRVIAGDMTSYVHTNRLSIDECKRVAEIAGKAVKGGRANYSMAMTTPPSAVAYDVGLWPADIKMEDKVQVVQQANAAARGHDTRIKQVLVNYGDVVQEVTIANSLGRYVEDTRVRTRMIVHAVAANGGMIQTGYDSLGETRGFELFHKYAPADLGQSAAQKAITMLEAKPAPAGKMPVVMAGKAGGTMVHEACGHGLEADLVQKGLSVYAGKRGTKVAAESVTVVDDGTIPGKYGTMRYDDEGMPTQKTILIKDGILTDYMYDYLTASKERRASTGNGRRESYQHKPIPRMRNTYIAPGREDPGTIISSVKHGLLVKKMGGGQVNTVNGDFVFDVAEGYMIKDGQISHAVRGATLTGNGPEVLNIVEMVGNDLGYTIGTCGKDGQGAPVSDAQPTMLLKQMIVGGTEHIAGESGNCCINKRSMNGPSIKRIRRY